VRIGINDWNLGLGFMNGLEDYDLEFGIKIGECYWGSRIGKAIWDLWMGIGIKE